MSHHLDEKNLLNSLFMYTMSYFHYESLMLYTHVACSDNLSRKIYSLPRSVDIWQPIHTSVAHTTSAAVRQLHTSILITCSQMKRTVTFVQTNILCYCISEDFYLIVVYLYWSCIHASFAELQWLDWYKGAAATVHYTQLPLSNLNSRLHCDFYCGY